MNRRYILNAMIVLTAVLCGMTGMLKWPGVVSSLGHSYEGILLGVVTMIHGFMG